MQKMACYFAEILKITSVFSIIDQYELLKKEKHAMISGKKCIFSEIMLIFDVICDKVCS